MRMLPSAPRLPVPPLASAAGAALGYCSTAAQLVASSGPMVSVSTALAADQATLCNLDLEGKIGAHLAQRSASHNSSK